MYQLHLNPSHPNSVSPTPTVHPIQAYSRPVYSNQAYIPSIPPRSPSPRLVGYLPAQPSIVAHTPDSALTCHPDSHPNLQYSHPNEYLPGVYADENNNLYVEQNQYVEHPNNFAILARPNLEPRFSHPDNSYPIDPRLAQSNPYVFPSPHAQVFNHVEFVPSNMPLHPSPDLQEYNPGFVVTNTLPIPSPHHPQYYNPEFIPVDVLPNQGYVFHP